MNIKTEKATIDDIDALVQMRLDYLTEDYGLLTNEQIIKIRSSLPDYYKNHLNKDLHVYIAREKSIVSCCFLLVTEKPANPSFINGRIGCVLNVYTKPEYRNQGIAKKLIEQLVFDANKLQLDYTELKSTDEARSLRSNFLLQEKSRNTIYALRLFSSSFKKILQLL